MDDSGLVSLHIAKTTPPVVLISSPADGTTVFVGDSLQLSADVSDDGTVARVDSYLDSALVLGGQLTLTLLKAIGQGFEVHTRNLPRVIESIYELQGRHQESGRKIIHTQARQFHSS